MSEACSLQIHAVNEWVVNKTEIPFSCFILAFGYVGLIILYVFTLEICETITGPWALLLPLLLIKVIVKGYCTLLTEWIFTEPCRTISWRLYLMRPSEGWAVYSPCKFLYFAFCSCSVPQVPLSVALCTFSALCQVLKYNYACAIMHLGFQIFAVSTGAKFPKLSL